MKHTLDKDRFHAELSIRGWRLSGADNIWIAPAGMTRVQMEQCWVESILVSIHCPHEEAGVE